MAKSPMTVLPGFSSRITRDPKVPPQDRPNRRNDPAPIPRSPENASMQPDDSIDNVNSDFVVGETPLYLWSKGLRPAARLPSSPIDPDTVRTMMYASGFSQPGGILSAAGRKAAGASLVLTATPPAATELTVPGFVLEVGTSDQVPLGDFTVTFTGTSKAGAAYTSGALAFKVTRKERQRLVVFGAQVLDSGNLYPRQLRARTTFPVLPTGTTLPGNVTLTGPAIAPAETLVATVSAAPDGMYFGFYLLTPDQEAWYPGIRGLIAAQRARFG